jgi:AI-2 transport protein TqsA
MQAPSILKPILILASAAVLLTTMHFAASFLVPVFLGIFFATLLTPIYKWFKKLVPPVFALLVSIGFLILIALFLVLLVGHSLDTLISNMDEYANQLGQRQAGLVAKIESLGHTVDLTPLISVFDPAKLADVLRFVVGTLAGIFKDGLVILMVTIFFLAESPRFIAHLKRVFGEGHSFPPMITSLAQMMIGYFGLRALVNLVNAIVTGLMLWIFNIPYSALWAVLIFFLSFIPYIGAVLSMVPPLILAYAQSGFGLVIIVGLSSVVINSLSENVLQPMVMGKGLSVSPTVVFLSVMFWMFILGGPGAFLAMPLTMAIILFFQSFSETRGIASVLVTTSDKPVTK